MTSPSRSHQTIVRSIDAPSAGEVGRPRQPPRRSGFSEPVTSHLRPCRHAVDEDRWAVGRVRQRHSRKCHGPEPGRRGSPRRVDTPHPMLSGQQTHSEERKLMGTPEDSPAVERDIAAPVEVVWSVLADGWSYANWVVGTARVRMVEDGWPAPGRRIHHSVGVWPLLLNDTTAVLESQTRVDSPWRPAGGHWARPMSPWRLVPTAMAPALSRFARTRFPVRGRSCPTRSGRPSSSLATGKRSDGWRAGRRPSPSLPRRRSRRRLGRPQHRRSGASGVVETRETPPSHPTNRQTRPDAIPPAGPLAEDAPCLIPTPSSSAAVPTGSSRPTSLRCRLGRARPRSAASSGRCGGQ